MAHRTVKEAAEEFGVTKQAVGKYLRSSGLRDECVKDGNRLLISDNAWKLLETHFSKNENFSTTKAETNDNSTTKAETNDNLESETIAALREALETMRGQLAIKDEQISALNIALVNAQEQVKAAQLLHAADRKDDLLLPDGQEQEAVKETWGARIKRALGL